MVIVMNKEYIEREEVRDAFYMEFDEDYADDIVDRLPIADVQEVRHGKWEQCFEDWRKQIVGDECSECGFKHYGTNIRNYHYCPNCGAKMDKE